MYIDKALIEVALGVKKADKIIKGAQLVNVFSRTIAPSDVAICDKRIAAVGDVDYTQGDNTEIIDAKDSFLVPGLIDPHIHPEVSKLTITKFAEAALAKGTTSIFCSFDQIGVTAGLPGIRFCLDEAKRTALKIFHSSPSRLPYTTPASTVGFDFDQNDHEQVMQWEEANGMWETMIESIENFEEGVLEPANAYQKAGKLLHGHLPFTFGPQLNAAASIGIRDDHESWFAHEVIQKTDKGIYSFLRKASCVDNIKDCIKAITEQGLPSRYIALCADDIDASELIDNGYMDHLLRYAIQLGVDPVTAIQMCSINAAQAGRVDHWVGSITPGRYADILIVKDLTEFTIEKVYANGELMAENRQNIKTYHTPEYPAYFYNTMALNNPITPEDIHIKAPTKANSAEVIVMQLLPNQIRIKRNAILNVENGIVQPDPNQDVCYISVTDRYTGDGKTASAFIGGFSLKEGAFATSLSPDDDNIICIGANVEDMVIAINRLFALGGGQIVVCNGAIKAELPLPICGIMSEISAEEMKNQEEKLKKATSQQGVSMSNPFFSQIFLSITAIPEYAITDQGLVSYETKDYNNPIINWHN